MTRILAKALQYLRYNDGCSRILWIDYICINQPNLVERYQQGARMADIYSEAKGVIVWLGSEYDGSVRAMSTLNALGSETKVDWPMKAITPFSWEDHHHWIKEPLPFAPSKDVLDSVGNLLDRDWFTRLWIWQEVCLARIRLRCAVVT